MFCLRDAMLDFSEKKKSARHHVEILSGKKTQTKQIQGYKKAKL